MQANAVNCTTDKKWIHKKCTDVHGDLSLGVHVDGFRCKRCDGAIPEDNIAENLEVDGQTYWCVKSFCYVWDTVNGDVGAHLAATPRIRNGWMKFRELLSFLTSRDPPLVW